MKEPENDDNNETKENSLEYLEEVNSKNSDLNSPKSEDNNILQIKEEKKQNQNEIENLKNVKTENNNINKEFIIPPELKKTYKITIFLTIIGIILVLSGIAKAVIIKRISGGIMFWILAFLVLIPGGFYSYQFYKAKTSKREYERQEILDSIPKLQ